MKKYIIWDFDGTLANTNEIIIASWQASFRHFLGHELPVRDIEATFGETLMHTIPNFIPGVEVDEVINFYREFQDSHHDVYNVRLFDGVRELIEELRSRGCLIGIGTSRTAYSLGNYIRELGIEKLIDEIVTMEDVKRHKPHPETVTALLDKFGAEPGEAIMIGDTKFDIGCANAAGVDSVLVGWSHYVDEADMEAAGFAPTYRIKTPKELLEII